VRPEGIIFPPPFFNQHLGLFQGIEDLTVEPFITEFAIEALDVTVFPRAARFNKERLNIKVFEPLANNSGRELGTVIRADMLRRAMLNKEIREAIQDIIRLQASLNDNSQTLPTILIITVNILMGRHHGCGLPQSHKPRHGSDGSAEDEHRSRHEAKDALVSPASWEL